MKRTNYVVSIKAYVTKDKNPVDKQKAAESERTQAFMKTIENDT